MAGIFVPIVADARQLLASFRKASNAADTFGRDLKQLGLTAEQSARKEVEAATRRDARLRGEIATYRQIAAAAQKGSREQIAAANLATQAEGRLARSLGVTSREAKVHARNVAGAEREISRFSRGALAGSGLARSLGRSLAFASGGFLAVASVTGFLRAAIDQGTKAAAIQAQMAAQFRESGIELAKYHDQIQSTTLAVSRLAGFEDDELTKSFTTAFRATRNVEQALTIMRVAADAARGSHRDLQSITLGLTRAWGGAATSLRRLGILIPTTAKGMDAITFVQRRFAGQAAAGTTAQQRFGAALVNTEQTIGMALLPSLNAYLNRATNWLASTRHQRQIQVQVNQGMRVAATLLTGLANAYKIAAGAASLYVKATRPLEDRRNTGAFSTLFKVLFQPGFGLSQLAKMFGGGGGVGMSRQPGQNTLDRQPGRSPGGAAAFPPIVARNVPGPLGFRAQFANLELRLAQAQLTQQQRDDRLILQAEVKLLRERIKTLGTSRKTLAERTQLTQQLVSIEGQIASIDNTGARVRKSAADKALAARKAVLAAEAKRLADEKTAANKELSTLKQRESNLKQQIKSITESFQSAVQTARSGIGDLFGGPILNFSDEQRKAALGIPNQASDPRAIARDITAQNRQFVQRQRLINRIVARAPRNFRGLVRSDIENLDLSQLQGIGAMNSRQFAALIARERLSRQTARVQMRAQLVTLHADRLRLAGVQKQENHIQVFIDNVEQKQAKVKVKQSAVQRRGPVPGRG